MKKSLLLIPILATSLLVNCGGGPKKYKITWENYNGDFLARDTYNEGEMPTYNGETPTRLPDKYQYTFSGWSPNIEVVKEDKTYKATYNQEIAKYIITWKDGDNNILKQEKLNYGSLPKYTGETPTKSGDERWVSYKFSGWLPEIHSVDNNCTYYARFDGIDRQKHLVKWVDNDEKQTVLDESEVAYGEMPIYKGVRPAKVSLKPGYCYIFSHWDKEPHKVEGPQTYVACYDEIEYPVTYVNITLPSNAQSCDVKFSYEGIFDSIDWGDESTKDAKNASHTYDKKLASYNIKVKGLLTSFSCVDAVNNANKYITSIDFADYITKISPNAFVNCASLKSINIPDSVISIGDDNSPNPFYNCPNLKSIIVDSNNPKYTSGVGVEGANAIIDKNTNTLITGCVDTIIPDIVEIIAKEAFRGCTGLKSIRTSIARTIGEYAFAGCTSLKLPVISAGIAHIRDYAFCDCKAITSTFIPQSVRNMGYSVFSGCDALKEITSDYHEEPIVWHPGWKDGCVARVIWNVNPPKP